MKWLFCGAGVVLLAALLLTGYKKLGARSTDDVDGGVVKRCSGDDAPKVIESAEIVEFHCVVSLIAAAEPGELDKEADASFLEALQEVVSRHDLAAHNGFVHTVSGLPEMYGARLDIRYASGESIYAHDNQSCFLALEAMLDLSALFMAQNEE